MPTGIVVAPAPDRAIGDGDYGDQRYRWRCLLCQLFARQYLPDKVRMKAAQDYAYSRRAMIHDAFDHGVIKAVVLNALRLGFETAQPVQIIGETIGDRNAS
jgi:hypothetical protein